MVNQRRHQRQACHQAVKVSLSGDNFVLAILADYSKSGSFVLLPADQHDYLPRGSIVTLFSEILDPDQEITYVVVRHNEAGVGLVRPEHQVIH